MENLYFSLMDKIKMEGIVVQAIPFRDYDSITTLFTPHDGLIKLYCHGAYSPKKGTGAAATPLTTIEAVVSKGRSDIYTCYEASSTHARLALRQSLPVLNAACDMIQAVATTQQPGKAAPELYRLLTTFLNRLPEAATPDAIAGSFRLKLLRYEGLLGILSHCCTCAAPLDSAWLAGQDAYCRTHAVPGALLLSQEERQTVEILAFSRDFSALGRAAVPSPLKNKIVALFAGAFA